MASHTDRQLEAWLEWLDLEWNRPSRADHYMMRVAQAMIRMWTKSNPSLDELKIPFSRVKQEKKKPAPMSVKAIQSQWFAFVGYDASRTGT